MKWQCTTVRAIADGVANDAGAYEGANNAAASEVRGYDKGEWTQRADEATFGYKLRSLLKMEKWLDGPVAEEASNNAVAHSVAYIAGANEVGAYGDANNAVAHGAADYVDMSAAYERYWMCYKL